MILGKTLCSADVGWNTPQMSIKFSWCMCYSTQLYAFWFSACSICQSLIDIEISDYPNGCKCFPVVLSVFSLYIFKGFVYLVENRATEKWDLPLKVSLLHFAAAASFRQAWNLEPGTFWETRAQVLEPFLFVVAFPLTLAGKWISWVLKHSPPIRDDCVHKRSFHLLHHNAGPLPVCFKIWSH